MTIVVDNFNCETYVREAVESALAQTYERIEVIVVDDGSTDSSRAILDSYRHRVHLLFKENGGQGSAFNVGFATSHGDVVIFLDADDVLLPRAAEAAAAALSNPSVSVAHWPLAIIGVSGARGFKRIPSLPLSSGDLRSEVIRHGPGSHIVAPTSGNAWSRAFLLKVLPMPEETFQICADNYLVTLSPIYGELIAFRRALGCYRVHDANRYYHRTALDKTSLEILTYRDLCILLQHHLALQGVSVDPEQWPRENRHFRWIVRVHRILSKISDVIPKGCSFVLIDGGKLGSGTTLVTERTAFPFSERNGSYCGLPWSDLDAEQELSRLHTAGASYLVIIADLHWWLEEHRGLAVQWDKEFCCILADDDVMIYRLN